MEFLGYHVLALWIGFLLDKLLGDPLCLPHPIVLFGKSISFLTRKLNKGKYRMLKGAVSALILIGITFSFFVFLITYAYYTSPILGLIIESIVIFFGLAGTTLIKEGKAVFEALSKDLSSGRTRVGRIVGRDTSRLSANEVKAATLETLAENLSDGVIAPLFWLALLGAPGMMTYKMVNTLDSMIGYKNEEYHLFGKVAARIDDISNFIPARITAILMGVCNGEQRAFRFIQKFGNAHSSPNAGYPEAALAGILNVSFGGTHSYFGKSVFKPVIGETKRDFNQSDLNKTIQIMRRTELLFLLILTVISSVLLF
ncbi:MAG: adenosylcobinamide-phosphate synthase CbiB [Mangrovibacterium sp.]